MHMSREREILKTEEKKESEKSSSHYKTRYPNRNANMTQTGKRGGGGLSWKLRNVGGCVMLVFGSIQLKNYAVG